MSGKNLYCLVLAGGKGTRLWPLSRELFPKQFLDLDGRGSLFLLTLKRAASLVPPENIFVVLEEKQVCLAEREIAAADLSGRVKVVVEPEGKNTAPAVLLGTLEIASCDEDAVVTVFPSDHVVEDTERFREHVKRAVALAEKGYVVTFGIRPTRPETGYGYIEGGDALAHGGLGIKRFVEKPGPDAAEEYFRSGNFFWNSGMFVFRAATVIGEYEIHCPDILVALRETSREKIGADVYAAVPSMPIDRAIMENTSRGAVVPSSFSWTDMGSWRLFYDFFAKDSDGNVLEGDVTARNTKNSLVKSTSRPVRVSGLRDVAVVETEGAVFVSDLESSHLAGEFAREPEGNGGDETSRPRSENLAWGESQEIEKGKYFSVRKTTVFPGKFRVPVEGSLSSLCVVVLAGKAVIGKDPDAREVRAGESVFLASERNCLVKNAGDDLLVILEIFSGR